MRQKSWKEAFLLVKNEEALSRRLNVAYAGDLILSKEYEKALDALEKGGEKEGRMKLLEELSETFIARESFQEASKYLYGMAKQILCINENEYYK